MKKIITLIVASIITISLLIIPKKNIVKAEEIINTISFMHKQVLTTQDDQYLIDMDNDTNINNVYTNNTLFSATYNNNDTITTWNIVRLYYTNVEQQWNEKTINILAKNQNNGNQWFYIRYYYNNMQYRDTYFSPQTSGLTEEEFYTLQWEIVDNTIFNSTTWQNLKDTLWKVADSTLKLDTPTINLSFQTITWQAIENAEYYNIFRNGNLIGQTESTQWVTITNGTYTIQACTNNSEIVNSNISNSVIQDRYNDMIGNGANWYTFFSAWVDTTIHLLKSMINYEIWGINFFKLLQLAITIVLTWVIIKFVIGF